MPPQVEKRALISDSATSTISPAKRTRVNNHAASAVTRRPVTRAYALSMRKVFPFMELPGELRNSIYEIVIADMGTTVDTPIELAGCRYRRSQQLRFTDARTNLATCRLSEVSHTIRREFLPMLWDSLHFRICACAFWGHHLEATFKPPIRQVVRRVRHLTWDSHPDTSSSSSYWTKETVRIMTTLEFEGTFRCIICKPMAASFRHMMISASEKFRQGIERDEICEWFDWAFSTSFLEKIFLDGFYESSEITFSVNFQKPKDDSGADTASKGAKDG